MNLQVSTQRGLPKTLIDEGLISADKMTDAINRAKLEKCSLVTYLCQEELVDGDKIAQLAATEFGMALYDLDNHDASTLPKDLVDTKLLRKHLLLPLFIKGKRLYIATPDPFDTQGLREIQFQVRMPVEPVLVTYSQIMALREGLLNDPAGTLVESLNIDEKEYQAAKQSSGFDVSDDTDADGDGESTPIVRFINKMILDAIAAKASDIHFEPYDQYYRVRFRIDGILRQIFTPPPNWSARLVSRIKIMADLDITERATASRWSNKGCRKL